MRESSLDFCPFAPQLSPLQELLGPWEERQFSYLRCAAGELEPAVSKLTRVYELNVRFACI